MERVNHTKHLRISVLPTPLVWEACTEGIQLADGLGLALWQQFINGYEEAGLFDLDLSQRWLDIDHYCANRELASMDARQRCPQLFWQIRSQHLSLHAWLHIAPDGLNLGSVFRRTAVLGLKLGGID